MNRGKFLEEIAAISTLAPALALLPALGEEAFAQAVHARAKAATNLGTLNALQDATVTGMAEILLPETDTVGATGVGVNRFIDVLLSESMLEGQRDRFLDGLAAINARCHSQYGVPFGSAGRAHQESLVRALDARLPRRTATLAEREALAKEAITPEGGFALLKALVVLAYFTSEPVAKGRAVLFSGSRLAELRSRQASRPFQQSADVARQFAVAIGRAALVRRQPLDSQPALLRRNVYVGSTLFVATTVRPRTVGTSLLWEY